jgi:hypothetical protein
MTDGSVRVDHRYANPGPITLPQRPLEDTKEDNFASKVGGQLTEQVKSCSSQLCSYLFLQKCLRQGEDSLSFQRLPRQIPRDPSIVLGLYSHIRLSASTFPIAPLTDPGQGKEDSHRECRNSAGCKVPERLRIKNNNEIPLILIHGVAPQERRSVLKDSKLTFYVG